MAVVRTLTHRRMYVKLHSIRPPLKTTAVLLPILLLALAAARAVPAPPPTAGEHVFRRECAVCHGDKGQGTPNYNKLLTGTLSKGELARFISTSMPPGAKHCTGPAAAAVAGYIYDAFYSPAAQARSRPARIELSRLTVRQFRNAVADLIASFGDPAAVDPARGLRGDYYKTFNFDDKDRVLQRVDPQIRFDFGTKDPTPQQTDPYQFAMRWEGSVIAPDTGDYEFIVHTDHAVQLWVDDMRAPIIDAAVKSGSGTQYTASIFLVGGRPYPIRLKFWKGVTGVSDLSKVKAKPPAPASLSLEWEPPKRPDQVIPAYCLLPAMAPETFAVSTPFPPDDRSMGYERGNSVSKAWDDAATDAALETAHYVAAHLRRLSGVADDAPDRLPRLHRFSRLFVERAFRRPITDAQARFYVDQQFERSPDVETAVKRVVLLALASPQFLYEGLDAPHPDAYDVASRLSLALWDSIPDAELLKAAAAGELATPDQIRQQAERMARDWRAWTKLRAFLMQWFKVDQYPDLVKLPGRFPGWDAGAVADLRTSFELYLQNTVWNDRSDYRDLMLSDRLYLNGRLAQIYGAKLAADAPFQPVEAAPGDRCGVVTQPYILASFAYADSSDPIHRGVLLTRNLLGRILSPPMAAFVPLPASKHPDLTTRERVSLQTKPAMCQACHGIINPLGFTLERYDAIGRLRSTENGKQINCTGSYVCRTGKRVEFAGAPELARYLANGDDAREAFTQKLFQYLIKQPAAAFGPLTLPNLQRSFAVDQYSIRKLMVTIAVTSATRGRAGSAPGTISVTHQSGTTS